MKSLATVIGVLALTASVASAQGDVEQLAQAAAHANAGRHPQAIALYEQVYARTGDHELLPVLGVEYRRTGAQLDAVQHFCAYLTLVPAGDQTWFATNQVIAIRHELGETIDATNVCAPVIPRVDFAPRPKAKKSSLSTRQRAAIASATIGAASLGAALYFDIEARRASNELVAHPTNEPWPADINDVEARGMRAERRSLGFAAIGGAALITAGVLWVTGRESETVIAPTVSSSGGGVTLMRGF